MRKEKDITNQFRVTSVSENWFAMDYASASFDGVHYDNRKPVQQIFEQLLRREYKGKLHIRQTFRVQSLFAAHLVAEKMQYLSASLNGHPLQFEKSKFDVQFVQADVSGLLRVGENVFEYVIDFYEHDGVFFALFDPMATESLRNCLYFDTSVETAYLVGDFVVDRAFELSARPHLPAITDRLFEEGYPFFKGEICLEGEFDYDGKGRAILSLEGRYMAADLWVNGKRTDLVYDTEADITQLLHRGKNHCRMIVKSSLRNLFGPHHFKPDPEPKGVNPQMFTFRGGWVGEAYPDSYTDAYSFVPFGVKAIQLVELTVQAK